MNENEIGKVLIEKSIAIHRELGPGLFETVYETILCHKLRQLGLDVQRQVMVPIRYGDFVFEEGFRADLIIEGKVLVELKSVEEVSRAHKKQVLTYIKLMEIKLGYLINFGEAFLKDGLNRIVNGLEEGQRPSKNTHGED